MSKEMEPYEKILLAGWEDVYRKSQLSLMLLLALRDGPKFTPEAKDFITKMSNGLQTTDEQSLYRALRRYHKAGMVTYHEIGGNAGPNRKRYSLTDIGDRVLAEFLERNIMNIYYQPEMQALITQIKKGAI